ncbi:MAG TPA: thrombospondin type 3 repeat-containing protein [Polyangiaceae bacterium]
MPIRAPRRLLATLVPALLGSAPAAALAQTLPSIDARTWTPSVAPQAGLILEPTQSPGPWQWNTGAWVSYAQSPVALRDSSGNLVSRPLDHALGADLVASVGLGERAALGIDLPVLLFQDGTKGLSDKILTGGAVPTGGVGDVSLLGKATIVSNDRQGVTVGFGLAALASVSLPTGDRQSFAGDGSLTAGLRLLGEYAFGVGALRASLGYALHTDEHTWPDASLGGTAFGDRIPWSVGATLRPKALSESLDDGDRQSWEIAAHGWVPAGPVAPFGLGDPGAAALSPALLAVDDRVAVGHFRDAFVLVGADIGLDQAVGVPTFRAVVAAGWAPRDHDRDHDGIPDEYDECPDLAEDRDGIQDQDGCPEDDADGDGILDDQDACPTVPGVWWNDPKKNGCPAPDTDGDGVPDPVDACPAVKGIESDDPKKNGCPAEKQDRDNDGIPDDADKCPDQAEDKDGNEDFDGCPDPDDDGDGIPDKDDACPRAKGEPSTDPTRNGCPNPDRDGDTYDNDVDQCPDQAEVFNGVKDDDGCPDEGGKLLVVVEVAKGQVVLRLAQPVQFTPDGTAIEARSATTLRAIGLELNRRPDWTLAVGARPGPGKPEDAQRGALEKAMLVANRLAGYTHRPSVAEAVGWDAVKQQPGAAASGLGLAVLVAPAGSTPAAPLPEKKDRK